MCAKKLSRSAQHGRAEDAESEAVSELDDSVAVRILRTRLSWKEWVLRDWLRYWYGLGAFALDAFVMLWCIQMFQAGNPYGGLAVAIALIALISLEYWGYKMLWPVGPFRKEQA